MISVFSTTNRLNNKTFPFADAYVQILNKITNEPVQLLDFKDLSFEFLHDLMYDSKNQSPQISEFQDKYLKSTSKWVFFIPEYNGSFPGILKLFIDACSIRDYKQTFNNKKAALIGISEGRSGNVKGLDHFTSILNHMGTVVFPDKMPISRISQLLDDKFCVSDQDTLLLLEKHATAFLDF